jgi:hypothetical protein
MKLKYCLVFAALAFVFSIAPASASVTEYTSVATFNAAVSGATSYNFEGIATNPPGYLGGNTTVGGVLFTAPSSAAFAIDGFYNPAPFGGAAFFSGQADPAVNPSHVTATLAGMTAIGFYYGPGDNAGGAITAILSTGDTFNLAVPVPYDVALFVGFTSSTPITSVAFSEQGYGMDIIQFELGTAATSTVPEPTTMLLLGLGLVGLAGVRRKFKK